MFFPLLLPLAADLAVPMTQTTAGQVAQAAALDHPVPLVVGLPGQQTKVLPVATVWVHPLTLPVVVVALVKQGLLVQASKVVKVATGYSHLYPEHQ